MTATGRFDLVRFVDINVPNNAFVAIDFPRPVTTVHRPLVIAGWSTDAAAHALAWTRSTSGGVPAGARWRACARQEVARSV